MNNVEKTCHYWLHRVSHENGLQIFDNERVLTIGFASIKSVPTAKSALEAKNWDAYCREYTRVYNGEIERIKNSLWRFVNEMHVGDVVVVPRPWGFNICRITSDARPANRGTADLGWERDVDVVEGMCTPREAYAPQHLLSRMKCRQTNLCIDDLSDEIVEAEMRLLTENPYRLIDELALNCHEHLAANNSPEYFEQIVCDYFSRAGADAHVLPKNVADKAGDCDVEAVFESLKMTISVQCKKHEGKTDEMAVRQIIDYDDKRADARDESNWMYQKWVITSGDGFTEKAKVLAEQNNVILVAGLEFSRMLIKMGVGM